MSELSERLNEEAEACEAEERWAQAAALHRQRIPIDPDPENAYSALVYALQMGDAWDALLSASNEFITKYPANADAHLKRSIALQKLGRLDEALAAADAAVSEVASDTHHWQRASVLAVMGRPEDVVKTLRAAIAAGTDDVEEMLADENFTSLRGRLDFQALRDFDAKDDDSDDDEPEEEGSIEPAQWVDAPTSETLGEIEIASGVVVVSDAGVLDGGVNVAIAPGRYIVRIQTDGAGFNLAAVLIRARATPVAFERVGAYPVDAGMSGFFDGSLHARASQFDFDTSIYDDLICKHLDPREQQGHAGAFVPFERSAFSACRSGEGDGVYPVFVGKDAQGDTVAIVTTFR